MLDKKIVGQIESDPYKLKLNQIIDEYAYGNYYRGPAHFIFTREV